MSIFDDTSPSWAATPAAAGDGAYDGYVDALDKNTAKTKAGYPQAGTQHGGSDNSGSTAGNGGFQGSIG